MRTTPTLLALAALALAPGAAADSLGVGSRLPALTLEDQHGEPHTLDPSLRAVLLSRDMDGGGVIREVLEEGGPALLEGADAVYVADVHGMPGVIRSLIAKPRMRRRPYPMLLDEEGGPTAPFPSEEGKATLILLEELEITGVEHLDSPEDLRAALEALRESGATPSEEEGAAPEPSDAASPADEEPAEAP